MGTNENRRDFLKTAGLLGTGMVAAGLARKAVG